MADQDFSLLLSAFPKAASAEPQPGSAGSASAPQGGDRVAGFVETYLPLAQKVSQKTGVAPEALLGQWGLETGWGKSVIPGTNNLGNIKDFSGNGTKAVDNMTKTTDAYRQYDTVDEFGDDFAGLLARRYKPALNSGQDAQKYFSELKRLGYAEDPNYVNSGVKATRMVSNLLGTGGNQSSFSNVRPLATDRTATEAVTDNLLGAGAGVVTGAKLIADAFGANNAVSSTLEGASRALMDNQSQYRKDQRTERAIAIKQAEGTGSTWEEIKANVAGFAEAPLETTLNALGTSAPTLLMSVIPGLGQAQAARLILQGAMGATQGVGAAKGSIYEAVFNQLKASGMSEDDAAKAAAGAQAYDSENGGMIAANAILGAVAGTSGIEAVTGRLVGRTAAQASGRGIAGRVAMGVAKESPVESAQGGTERATSNVALQNQGFDVPTMQGVAGQAAGEALASAPGGAVFGAIDRPAPIPAIPPQLQPVADKAAEPNSPLSKAALAGTTAQGVLQQATTVPPDGTPPAAPPAGVEIGNTANPMGPGASADPYARKAAELEQIIRGQDLVRSIRTDGAGLDGIMFDLRTLRDPNAREDVKQAAQQRIEEEITWAQTNWSPKPQMDSVANTPGFGPVGQTREQAPQSVMGLEAVQATLRDPQIGPRVSETDRQNILQLTQVAQNPSLPVATRQQAAQQAIEIVGLYRAAAEPVTRGQQVPAEPALVSPEGQQNVAPATEPAAQRTPAGTGPAVQRRRGETLAQLVSQGFETVERREGEGFFLKNSKTGQEIRLEGMADAAMARNLIRKAVDEKANTAAASPLNDRKEPTEAQIAAGNYKKSDVIDLNGMKIKIENPKDSIRRGTSPDGVQWETKMAHHYGEFQGTEGADGDKLDVFVGPRPDSSKVFVIDQVNEDGSFDEHKVMMGFTSEEAAREGYLANYEPGWTGLGAITEMPVAEFKAWAKSRQAKKPLALGKAPAAPQAAAPAPAAQPATEGQFATLEQAEAYLSQQRRANGSISGLPLQLADGSFGIAIKGTPQFAVAQGQRTERVRAASAASNQGDFFTVNDGGKAKKLKRVKKTALPKKAASVRRLGEPRAITQEEAGLIEQIAAVLGKRVVFFESQDGRVGDGFFDPTQPDVLFVATETTVNPLAVFGHEFFHDLRETNPEAWNAIAAVVRTRVADPKGFRADYYGNAVADQRGDEALTEQKGGELEELVSDLGGNLMMDATFWRDVFAKIREDNGAESKGIIARLAAALEQFVARVVDAMKQGGFRADSFVTDLADVRKAYRDGLADYIKAAGLRQATVAADIAKAKQDLLKTPDRAAQPGALTVEGYHFSQQPRAVLSTGMFGTGLKGSAREEIMNADDARLRQRLYFYVDKGTGINPESGVGGYAHKATLTNIYDADADPLRLRTADARAFESKVLDNGFSGYLSRQEGTQSGQVILLGSQTVRPQLLGTGKVTGAKVVPAPQQRDQDFADRLVANKDLPSGMLSPRRWSEVLMAQDPELAAQLLDIGAFEGGQAMYKDELAGKVRQLGAGIRKSADRAAKEYADVEAKYKGTDQWMKALDGTATKLSERQWVQVRTPSFKKWFGDWEQAFKDGGVWSTSLDVSKAVGENGEPLVVYHGTDKGGFAEFEQPGGTGRGDLGIWTTPDYGMARSYVRKGRARDVQLDAEPSTRAELEELGFTFFEQDDGTIEVDTPSGYTESYDNEEDAIKGLVENYVEDVTSNAAGTQPGIYALFINVRNPNEDNFEGALWNGDRVDQYQVRDENDEPVYDENGRGYFDIDTANALAEANPGAEVQPADPHYNTTDDVVREALRSKQDGAIIREVIDDGGGVGYNMDPQDIFVAFDPTQVKSADYNNGEFSDSTGDLRKSEDRQYKLDIDREGRAVGKAARLTPEETQAIETDAKKYGLSAKQIKALVQSARDTKKQYPVAAGWAPIEVTGVVAKFDDDGAIKFDKDGNPQIDVKFREIGYAFNKPIGAKRAPVKMDQAWMNKVADKFGDLVMAIYRRAEKGDKNAQIIIGHQTWYRNVAEVLRREYGAQGDLLADLLGATSPNTPVDTNWRFSIDIMRRFVRGDFNADMEKFVEYLDNGGAPSQYPAADKIRQVSGKLYGMNSGNAMRALADMWRVIEPGTAPKARNFALNLIGQSNMATIDVWAARMLRRAANMVRGADLPRIPPVAEKGVSGVWNADATEVTGEFGFGAAVMDRVSKMLEKRGITVTPPDLQAIAWFAEKELWGSKGWTTKTGEGGSFEENIEAFPVERYLAGWSIQQGEKVPEQGQASLAQARVMSVLVGDDTVVAARVLPTTGLYGGAVEASFDTEWTAIKGQHDPSMAMAEIARIAKENDQYDIFVSRVVGPKEDNPNARPGVEIYFKTQRDLEAAMPVLRAFTSKGVDGFTMAVDPRAQTKSVAGEQFIGVRIQYVPEISMRWDDQARKDLLAPGGIEAAIEEKRKLLSDIAAEVRVMDGVAFAAMQNYDTVVVGKENYDEYIDRVTEGGDRQAGNQAWFGSPIRQGLEGAATRLRGDVGQNGAGGVSDAGSSIRASRSRDGRGGDQGRGLAPLPGAPNVQGASGPDPRLVEVAEQYARDNGITLRRQAEYVKVDPERAARIAAAYEAMPHDPQNPRVKEAFENLIRQTRAQYDALVNAGYKFTFFDSKSDPYQGNPWNAMRDLRANQRMAVYGTYDGYGTKGITAGDVDDNPMLADTGLQWEDQNGQLHPVLANDLFRAVHDAFGHGLEGAGFRAEGEENAWQAHVRLFTGSAVGAITSETRGQNSWLNYGPYGEQNRTAKVEDTVFAAQKTGLMPEWTWQEGVVGDTPDVEPSYNQRVQALKDLISCLQK